MTARKLHTLMGAFPLGLFLVLHLVANASALGGSASYARVVPPIVKSTAFGVVEIVLVFIPLAFHGLYGLHLTAKRPKDAAERYPLAPARMQLLARLSGVVILVFLIVHIADVRWAIFRGDLSPDGIFSRLEERLSSTQASVPWLALLYLLGVAAGVFHLANGLVSYAFTSGRAATDAAKRRAAFVFGGAAALLFVVGAATVIAFATGGRLWNGEATPDCTSLAPAAPAPAPPPAASSR